jgi:hypothetical protein
VTHPRVNSALLTGTVNPKGQETTFYFEFGPTAAYGSRTAIGKAGSGTTPLKVGQFATPFFVGYHYRLVATNSLGTNRGRDRTYTTKTSKLKFQFFKPAAPPVIGTPVTISGVLTGVGNAHQHLTLQASPFPFQELSEAGLETITSSSGRFIFHVGVLTRTTRFRVSTVDLPLPVLSKVLTEQIAVRVSFHVRPSGRRGFVRLYGTVTPAEVGSAVLFQVQMPAPPGRSKKNKEREFRWVTRSSTVVKHATRSLSRFSSIVKVHRTGLYRAVVVVRKGPLVSGTSRTLPLSAPISRRHKRG